jgi:hypothetical protein
MLSIALESAGDPDKVKTAPSTTPVGRLDEVRATKLLDVCWERS